MLPLQALLAGCVRKHLLVRIYVDDLPLLGRCVKANVRNSHDFEPAENMEVNRLRIEAFDVSASIESKCGFHDSPPPTLCWVWWRLDCRQKSGFRERLLDLPSASSMALVAASHPLPWNPSASTVISPLAEMRTCMRWFTTNLLPM